MNERHSMWRHHMPARDRQMLTAAYLPVIAFATVLIAERISRMRRHQLQGALR
jgi:hypothetical protein